MDIHVRHEDGDRFHVAIGSHSLVVDQPDTGDAGPTPTDLFVASLAACVAHYAGRFVSRHGIDPHGLGVEGSFVMATDRPARVAQIDLTLQLPAAFPDEMRDRLLIVVEHCTVHNSITNPPGVRIGLVTATLAA